MKYLIGSKKEFFEFINSIDKDDKVAVLAHDDLDGIASAVFLEEILKKKNIGVDFIDFLSYKKNMFNEISDKLKEEEISKVFICDVCADGNLEDFNEFRKKFEVFLIDHHPINPELTDKKNIIKTETPDCVALIVYNLGEGIIDSDEWKWLVCAAIFADMSYLKKENFDFIQSIYPDFEGDNLATSVPGIIARKIGSALIYYAKDKRRVYDLVKEKNLEELNHAFEVVEEEINYNVENFLKNAEFFPEKKLYWNKLNSKFNVDSVVATLVSKMNPEYTFVSFSEIEGGFVKISSRNQNKTEDMGKLMQKGIAGLESATGGGHVPAAAARIRREDLDIFKENILKL